MKAVAVSVVVSLLILLALVVIDPWASNENDGDVKESTMREWLECREKVAQRYEGGRWLMTEDAALQRCNRLFGEK